MSDTNRTNITRMLGYAATGGYLILAAVTLAWGTYKRFHIPQAPIVDPDIRGYLGPAMYALTGKGFVHLDGRSLPYPAFVLVILRLFGDFRAISVVQHILGVTAGALTLLAWNALLRLVPPGGIPRELSRFIGLGPAAIYLGSATAIHFEQEIRPEAVFPFLTILNLLVSFLFIHSRFIRRHSSAIWLGGFNVFIALLIYLLKPSFGLATLFSTAPVWISILLPGAAIREKGILLAAAILPALVLLMLPEQVLRRNDVWGRQFLPETLFSVHASIIVDQMSRDLATNAQTPWPREVLQSAHDLLQTDLQKAATITTPKAFPSLGYNPDYLMYDTFCVEFAKQTNWDPAELIKFYNYYYRRAWLEQPSAMLRKIAGQMRLFYCSKNPAYRLGQSLDVTDEYDRTPDLIAKRAQIGAGYAPLGPYFAECNALAGSGAAMEQVKRLTEWTRLLSAHYMDLLLLALVSPLVLICCPFRSHLLWTVVALWLVYSYNFGNCLTIAVVHSLEVTRYVRIQLIYTVFAQCLSIYFLLETVTYGARLLVAGRLAKRN
jgi:uncharacterized membrane protein YozB (DUF420 family)